jgi:hypothetical protein
MSRIQEEPKFYKHQALMDELNDFFIRLKIHLLDLDKSSGAYLKATHSKPTKEELDSIHNRIHDILSEDSKPMRRY